MRVRSAQRAAVDFKTLDSAVRGQAGWGSRGGVGGASWCSRGAVGMAGLAMSRTKQDVLDTGEAGLAGKRVLEQTMEHMKENWPDRR